MIGKLKKGSQVTCEVMAVQENGIEVKIADTDITTFIKRSDLSRDRSEQRPERFNVGDKVDAAIISLDKHSRRITVSIKALEIAEEKQAVAQYGSSDSGASLGDIFKAAIKKKEGAREGRRGSQSRSAQPRCGGSGPVPRAALARRGGTPGRCRTRPVRASQLAAPVPPTSSTRAGHQPHDVRDRDRPRSPPPAPPPVAVARRLPCSPCSWPSGFVAFASAERRPRRAAADRPRQPSRA